MKFSDMVRQSLQNLLRHKGRTFLTVLGVIVGCCSVVALASIGIGYSEVQQAILEQMGDLTKITVSAPYNDANKILDDAAVTEMKSISHVRAVIPICTNLRLIVLLPCVIISIDHRWRYEHGDDWRSELAEAYA